ncbi:serine/threonine protein kinase [Streptomyces sp. NPDC085481]|uniref:serine/threonine protein kinase n=1 Tax=Streptomyces sp. NPDC085481 TaxID=3365727 RepID=UPI0037D27BA2
MERPYRLITRLDPPRDQQTSPLPCHRFVARAESGDRTVLLTTPLKGTDPAVFRAEAEAAQRLAAPWTFPVTEIGGAPGAADVWFTTPYVPALPLPVALAVHGGPLPEGTVRVIGAALAETLAALHAQGVTHAGVTPAAVLLTADGPRLTCFGAARTTDQVDRGALAPEAAASGLPRPRAEAYATGGAPQGDTYVLGRGTTPPGDTYVLGRGTTPPGDTYVLGRGTTPPGDTYVLGGATPTPAPTPSPSPSPSPSDVYGLGAVLAYAATGHTVPERSELPPALRPTITACLTRDPANRPAAAELLPSLAPPTPHETVLGSAASLLTPGWLPARVVAALARQSAALLSANLPETPGN